jgi:hypothetical protein
MQPRQRAINRAVVDTETAAVLDAAACWYWRDGQMDEGIAMWGRGLSPIITYPLRTATGPPAPTGDRGGASTNGNNWATSWWLAPVSITAGGVPCASVLTPCLEPVFLRSLEFGPVSPPQEQRAPRRCAPLRAASRCGVPRVGSWATPGGCPVPRPPSANHADGAPRPSCKCNPHPGGRLSPGMAVFGTKRMPVRACRFGTRGHPFLGWGWGRRW